LPAILLGNEMCLNNLPFASIHLAKATLEHEWASVRQFRHTYFFGPDAIADPYEWTFLHKDHYHFLL